MCTEQAKNELEKIVGNIEFLEIQGMNLNAENKYNILVTPVLSPVTPAQDKKPEDNAA